MSNFPQKITSVTKTFSSFIIVSLISVLVVSCASSSGGGGSAGAGGGGGGVSVFSHGSYTFIPKADNVTLGSQITVGRVLIKDAEIRKLVAAEINRLIDAGNSEADKVEADDIANNDYTIKYSFTGADADDATSKLKDYFTINPDSGIINVSSPYSFPVSLENIFKDVPSVTVKVEVTITNTNSPVEVEKPLSYTVRVNFPGVADEEPDVNDAVSFDVTSDKVSPGATSMTPPRESREFSGTLSGTLEPGTALNGTEALTFTDLWVAANAKLADDPDPKEGKIVPNGDNVFKITDLINTSDVSAANAGLIQGIIVNITPSVGVDELGFTAGDGSSAAAPFLLVDVNTGGYTFLSVITDDTIDSNYYLNTGADGIQVLNATVDWTFTYKYQRNFQPVDVTVPGRVELNRTVQFGEEQPVTTAISIDGVNNALNRYGFRLKATEQRTIFFTLLDSPNSPANSCDSSNVYLDNQDAQVKAGTSFDYEDLNTEADRQHTCILGASFYGVDYQRLVAKINATTIPAANVNSGTAPGGCDVGFNCYYASLTVNITDVDEAPTVVPVSALSIAEGKGVDPKYLTRDDTGDVTGPAPVSGNLNDLTSNDATTGLADIPVDITIADTDKGANGNVFAVNATETKVISVSPAHGAGLFSIVKKGEGVNLFTLRVNATELDFEKFVEEGDLNAADKAIYMVTISTQDSPKDEKEGFDKAIVKTMQVPVEITDVKYAPVATGAGLGFARASNIENRSGDTVVLLPGASMLAYGRNALGAVKAVNPETDNDKGLFYAVQITGPAVPAANFAVVTGLGDGTTPQNLILRGLGLVDTDGVDDIFDLTIVAFSIPADFNSQDSMSVQTELVTSTAPFGVDIPNVGTGTNTGISISIPMIVEDDAGEYATLTLLDPATAPTFTRRQLVGNITEGIDGDNVLDASSTPLVLFNSADLNNDFINDVPGVTPAFAFVTELEFKGFGDTSALGINPADSALFSINSSSGAISLKEENEAVFPVFYNLVVRLANATDTGNIPSISLNHDYAVVTVLVNDKNSAPEISGLTNLINPTLSNSNITAIGSSASRLNITIDENTPAGTVLATFTVTDDNDGAFAEDVFTFGAIEGSASDENSDDNFYEDAVKLTFASAASTGKEKVSTATLTLVKPLNFEDFGPNSIRGDDITIDADAGKVTLTETSDITDEGRYVFDPSMRQVQSAPENSIDPVNPLNALLEFNLIVQDVVEKPLIGTSENIVPIKGVVKASVTIGSVMEDAIVGTIVDGIAVTIVNINATDADALVYELSDKKFDEVFDVVADDTFADGRIRILRLNVTDADKLEDLGDGQVHTSTLRVTNNTGGTGPNDASERITIHVRVIDVEQPIEPIDLLVTTFEIKETDVDGGIADRTHVITDSLFTYKVTDISKDADDFAIVGGIRYDIIDISYAITDVLFDSSTTSVAEKIDSNSAPAFSLKVPDAVSGNVSLVVGDTDYIEAALFGDITATLTFKGTSPNGEELPAISASPTFTVNVAQADPKNVEYTTASSNAPVYGFEYTQSEYAEAVTGGENVVLATAINGEGGLDSQSHITVDGKNYNTTTVRVPSNSNTVNTYFIERDNSEDLSSITRKGTANGNDIYDGTLVIRLEPSDNNKNITSTQILSEDASGKLEPATNFANYFDIKVNNTYTLDAEGNTVPEHKVLLITQEQFDVYHSNGSLNEDVKYNALDTIPLFKDGIDEETTRTYYIRASQGGDNASNYALAQFYVDIKAAGLNIPAEIEALYIDTAVVPDPTSAFANFDVTAGETTAMIAENSLTIPNMFNDYALHINIINDDYSTNQEGGGITTITATVEAGELLPDGSVTDNLLIALAPESSPDNAAVPADRTGDNSVSYGESAASINTSFKFALANNVHGTAIITIKLQENNTAGNEIDSINYEFTLVVEEIPNVDPTFTVQLTGAGETADPATDSLDFTIDEDDSVFTGDDEEKDVNVLITENTNNAISRGQIAEVTITGIDYVATSNQKNTPDGIPFFNTYSGSNTIGYLKDGWGESVISYSVTETEPRGFGNVSTDLYSGNAISRITVNPIPDAATEVVNDRVEPTYNLTDFQNAEGNFDPDAHPDPAKTLTIIYNDNDLKFADFEIGNDVLPEVITRGTQVVIPLALDATLEITPVFGGVPQPVTGAGTQFSADFTTDFAPITRGQYNNISFQEAMALYAVTFQGDGADNVVADIPITVEANEFRVLEDNINTNDIFKAATLTGEILPISEGNSDGTVIATIHAEDGDLARPLTETVESLTFTIGTIIPDTGVGNLVGKVRWLTSPISGSSGSSVSSAISNSIVVDALNDRDVGNYTIPWRISQSVTAFDGGGSITGSFTLDVQNLLEPLTLGNDAVVIDYPYDGMGILPERSTNRNLTIAAISGITIRGHDLDLPAAAGLGILVNITPVNLEGDSDGTGKQLIELVDFDNTDSNIQFENTKPSVTYFISTAKIVNGGTLPEFKLVADAEFAGDEFNVTVSAVLATGIADTAIAGADANAADEKEFATNYDIQSPPSDVSISSLVGVTNDGNNMEPELDVTEGTLANITIVFSDRNIENSAIELFAGAAIEEFNATLNVFNDGNNNDIFDDGEEVLYTEEITDPAAFTPSGGDGATAGTATVSFIYNASNAVVGDRNFEVIITDNRTKDATEVAKLAGDITIGRANSGFKLRTLLDIVTWGTTGTPLANDDDGFIDLTGTIDVLVNVTSEDFVEGGGDYDVMDLSIENFGFYINAKGETATATVGNACDVGPISFSDLVDITDEKRLEAEKSTSPRLKPVLLNKKVFRVSIPVQKLHDAGGNCARVDYDITGTFYNGAVSVTLNSDASSVQSVTYPDLITNFIPQARETGLRYVRFDSKRKIEPSVARVGATANVAAGGTATIEFTVTDGDPDDGPVFGVQSNRYSARISSAACATNIWDVTDPTPVDASSYMVNVTPKSTAASGNTCAVSIIVAEDGIDSVSSGLTTVTFADITAPTITVLSDGESGTVAGRTVGASGKFNTIQVTRRATPDQITNFMLNVGFAVTATPANSDCTGIDINPGTHPAAPAPGVATDYPFTYAVGPDAVPGAVCTITIKAAEISDGAEVSSTDTELTIIPRVEAAPTIVSLNIPADLEDLINYDQGFSVTARIMDNDIEDTSNDVFSKLSSTTPSVCTVATADAASMQSSVQLEDISWNIVIAGRPGQTCSLFLNSTANGLDDTGTGSVTLPQLAPTFTVNDYSTTGVTGTPVEVVVTITDTDNDGFDETVASIASADGCLYRLTAGEDTNEQTFEVSPNLEQEQECPVVVTVTEDGGTPVASTSPTLPITFMTPAAPTINSATPSATTSFINEQVTVNVMITDAAGATLASPDITAVIDRDDSDSDCSVTENILVVSGSTANQAFTVTAITAGTCVVNVTATANSFTSDPTQATITFTERPITITSAVPSSTDVEIDDTIQVPVIIQESVEGAGFDGAVFMTDISGASSCEVTESLLTVHGGGTATQLFNVTSKIIGDCDISVNVTKGGATSENGVVPTITFKISDPMVLNIILVGLPAIADGEDFMVNVTIANVGITDKEDDTISLTVVPGGTSNCIVTDDTQDIVHSTSVKPGGNHFRPRELIKQFSLSASMEGTCDLSATTTRDVETSPPFTTTIQVTPAPGDEGIVLAWSDQVHESPFNGYMSIGNAGNASDTRIPDIGTVQRVSNSFVPATIGSRLAMVQTRFVDVNSVFKARNYGETKFALSDGELGDTRDLVKHFLVQVEREEYVTQGSNVISRDTLLFYADTSSNHFDTTVLSGDAKDALREAEIERYLRFTTIAPPNAGLGTVKSSGNVRSVTTIPFAATYDNIKRLVRTENNRGSFILPGGDPSSPVSVNVSKYAGVTDLINIDVSNVPDEGAKISASICRLEGFDGAEAVSTTCTGRNATTTEIKNILLLGGYWDREPYTSCEAGSASPATTDFYGWYKNKRGEDNERDDYYCTASASSSAPVVPKTLISGATHENTLGVGSGNTIFPMHIRQFMNTLPEDTQVGDDYSLNERNGYYLITIQSQNISGTKIPGSNELKMLFHIGWEFP